MFQVQNIYLGSNQIILGFLIYQCNIQNTSEDFYKISEKPEMNEWPVKGKW